MNDNLRMIEVSATGYYSNATAAHTCWVTDEFVEKYEDEIRKFDFYFSDLDGKHSETHADIEIYSDQRDMALAWSESQGEDWSITEIMFDQDVFEDADIEEMISLNEDMNNTIEVKTQTVITIGTETIVV
ncbi:hypothetical protein COHAPHLL_00043 [Vibrio phage V09]|uniref:Uncharacterized protein n=1 Tax=Vibrio phage V09 TaxID=2724327 RepID=A0A6H0X937_9CAUD|nr:hypothetical protein COHAPHLL_00043 [Vibrio phage V09]